MKKVKILFVCLGNICRSPLAEAIFKHKVSSRGLDDLFEGDSCGTGDYHIGSQPDPRTIANAQRNKVPIDHCARQLSTADLEHFDYILAMDSSNLANILKLQNASLYRDKIFLFRDFEGAVRVRKSRTHISEMMTAFKRYLRFLIKRWKVSSTSSRGSTR